MTTVSPSSTSSPTWHSIFQTVPVMWATTSATNVLLLEWARAAYPRPWTTPRGLTAGTGGYIGAVSDEPAAPLPEQESPQDLTPIRAQVYRDPRPAETFDRFHARARTREPDLAYEVVRLATSVYSWTLFRVRGIAPDLVPSSGPVILAPNHSSFMDHFFLGASIRRKVSFMAKSQLFKPPLQFIYSHGGVFPVRRGFRDEEAFVTAAAILERGGCLALYREGRRAAGRRVAERPDRRPRAAGHRPARARVRRGGGARRHPRLGARPQLEAPAVPEGDRAVRRAVPLRARRGGHAPPAAGRGRRHPRRDQGPLRPTRRRGSQRRGRP